MKDTTAQPVNNTMDKNKGLDFTKENLADALGRPDLRKLIAQAMGSIKSKKKAKASRENGKKGGRPKKKPLKP